MKKIALLKLGIILTALLTPVIVMADAGELLAQVQINEDLRPEYAANIEVPEEAGRAGLANALLQIVSGALIYLAGPIAVFMLALGGLRYVVSRGDQTQMEEAKKTITWSIIGLVVIILSWAIVTNIMWLALQGGQYGSDQPTQTEQTGQQSGGTSESTGDTSDGEGGVTTSEGGVDPSE